MPRRTLVSALLAAGLAVPSAAGANTTDYEVVSAQPTPDVVKVGVPTIVRWELNVRTNMEAPSGRTGSVGPVDGVSGPFTTIGMYAQPFSEGASEENGCGAPTDAQPRCNLIFRNRPETQTVTVTDRVTATAPGNLTRTFTADTIAPDTEGNPANNRLTATLPAVAGQLPTLTNLRFRPRSTVPARKRKASIGKLTFTLDRPAHLEMTVTRRIGGKYRYWGTFKREGVAGANTQYLANRIDFRKDPPIVFKINRFPPGRYRISVVPSDELNEGKAVRASFTLRRRAT